MIEQWVTVENSSNVAAIGFDSENLILVLFKNGSLYSYNPGRGIFDAFLAAESKGSFIHSVLKQGEFPYHRIDIGEVAAKSRVE